MLQCKCETGGFANTPVDSRIHQLFSGFANTPVQMRNLDLSNLMVRQDNL